MFKLFKNAKVLQPDFSIKKTNILIRDESIYEIYDEGVSPDKPYDSEIDLDGHYLFPGLINSHDHLIDTCWKKLGKTPANTWLEWHNSVHASYDYKLMQRLSVADLYTLGIYKNTLSGVTTVIDHFPSEVSGTFMEHSMITVQDHIYVAHSVSDDRLEWCGNLSDQYKRTGGILPFITHVGEGNTEELKDEPESLNRMGALASNTVLASGVFLDEESLQLIATKKASMIWLPSASENVYGRQPNVKLIMELGIPLTIGTDSSNTGSSNLFGEFKIAKKYSENYCNNSITNQKLLEMTTIGAAKIFGIDKAVGSIAIGKMANLIAFEEEYGKDPFEQFINLKPEDFTMVVHKGRMIYGNSDFRRIPTIDFGKYSEIRVRNNSKLLYGRPIQLLERIRHKLDEDIVFPFLDIESDE